MALNYVFGNDSDTNVRSVFYTDENIAEYIKEISEYRSLSAEEEQELAKRAQAGNNEAKKELAKCNLKLVISIARKVIHAAKVPMIDLIQEGNIGLMAAIDKFNWKFGYRFATYASWWIKQAMFKAISEQSHSVKIPVYIQETLSKYSKIKSEMENSGEKKITLESVAEKMNISADKINNYLNAYKTTLSLEGDFEMQNGSEVKLIDILEDDKAALSDKIEYSSMKDNIKDMLDCLKDREQNVIILRFGLLGKQKQTLEEIGKIYGVTKECIRQTESRALSKLKENEFCRNLYNDYLCE